MPPKSKKDVQPVVAEDFSQDVLLLTTVQDVQLKLVGKAAYVTLHCYFCVWQVKRLMSCML